MGTPGEIIAEYVYSVNLDAIPKEVVEKTKACLLDTLCVAVAGSQSKEALIVQKVVSRLGGIPEATVINSHVKLPAPNAALINATMAHSIELDDTDRFTYFHPGAPIVMAALAMAEATGCSGKKLLEGILVGYETSIRIAEAINPSHRWRGFHTTGTVGTFGAGIASAKILGLEPPKIESTLGISGTQAAGLFEFLQDGSMIKRFHPGKSAWNGIMAAYLAESGFTGPASILEGENGFLKATSDRADVAKLTENLGKFYRILRVGIKRHAACRYCHTAIDAALEIKCCNDINIKEIDKVIVYVSKLCAKQTGNTNVSTLLGAQLSTPYAVALALVKGATSINAFIEGLSDPEVLSFMQKVEVKEYEEFGETGRQAVVSIKTKEGRSMEKKVDLAKGEPENPLTPMELKEKATELCKSVLGKQRAEQLLTSIGNVEKMKSIDGICGILRA
ncbi:MmgE/PrpD family protein [Neomoorella mulderi]|uniref:MmgE/PrpD family protein n=1 Tax=Moorella mulderi DSM 14980 TaxID=1122241 RepID=A0A151AVS7_9FIRM|nr:MmgE/PrpD family protein [Moorella mulderi]KYH31764.1 MmgE/PrpD family protein [Moorella mulderi DSM 14980]